MREEFFATYDVMTGIRIAATLGGFFFLMVFLIVYKSRSKSNKALRVSQVKFCKTKVFVFLLKMNLPNSNMKKGSLFFTHQISMNEANEL